MEAATAVEVDQVAAQALAASDMAADLTAVAVTTEEAARKAAAVTTEEVAALAVEAATLETEEAGSNSRRGSSMHWWQLRRQRW